MTMQVAFNQAVSLHQAGNLADAERLYQEVAAAEPENFPAHYQLAFLFYQQKRLPAALAAIAAALKINPDVREALMLQSVLLMNAGQLESALASVSKVAARDLRDAEAWHNRGVILAALHRWQEAVTAYDTSLAVRPTAEGWTNRGAGLLALARAAEALSSFEKALALKPAFVDALWRRGNALMDLKRYPEAVAAFDNTLVHAPALFQAWSNRGLALYEMERFADALESYSRAADIRPDHAPAWTNRGKALNSLARFDEALVSYEKAVALAPDNAEAWYARAVGLRKLYRFEEALDCVDRSLALQPGSLPALFFRGWVLCELNRITEGLAVIRRAAVQDLRSGTAETPKVSVHKQRHDAEQRDYLAGLGVALKDGDLHFADGEKLNTPAINPANAQSAAAEWDKRQPRVVVIDNLLTEEALEKLRRFCWRSTVWRKPYEKGYFGAMPEQGFACPLLAQIAEELRDTFPTLVGDHRLRMLWGFKYSSSLGGTGIHADQAAVNVNFWITPDAANLNPESGGMVIWDVAAPEDWEARTYNGDDATVRAFLAKSGAKSITVPYRTNRAVIFDSDLFHETDAIDFKDGYLNRRINLTMLYGRRTYYGS